MKKYNIRDRAIFKIPTTIHSYREFGNLLHKYNELYDRQTYNIYKHYNNSIVTIVSKPIYSFRTKTVYYQINLGDRYIVKIHEVFLVSLDELSTEELLEI